MEDLQAQLAQMQQQNAALQEQLAALQQQRGPAQQQPEAQPEPGDDAPQGSQEHPYVFRVVPKLPPCWGDNPTLWFAQVESQFRGSGITKESTKFGYVAGALDRRWATEVQDILLNPPAAAQRPYFTLKNELIWRLSLSEERRTRQLLNEADLRVRTPSQFLRYLRNLVASTPVQENVLRTLWLQRLPSNIQGILQCRLETPLNDLAVLVLEVSQSSLAVRATKATSASPIAGTSSASPVPAAYATSALAPNSVAPSDSAADLVAQVAALVREVWPPSRPAHHGPRRPTNVNVRVPRCVKLRRPATAVTYRLRPPACAGTISGSRTRRSAAQHLAHISHRETPRAASSGGH